jgi:ribosomal protein S18 acetylase RimI-like enzyme
MENWIRKSGWTDTDLHPLQDFIADAGGSPFTEDLSEQIQIQSIQESFSAWYDPSGVIQAVFFVDDYDNIHFDTRQPEYLLPFLQMILPEASRQAQARFADPGLDACEPAGGKRLACLLACGFEETDVHSLFYEYIPTGVVPADCTPPGFHVRPVAGEHEVAALVALHSAAVRDAKMDEEYRLAMMRVEGYDRSLDLLLETAGGELAAYCTCSIESINGLLVGYTDPVGVDSRYHRRGLGRAVLTAGVRALSERGVACIRLGTSSENISMQELAKAVGYILTDEKIWLHYSGRQAG